MKIKISKIAVVILIVLILAGCILSRTVGAKKFNL